MVKFGIGDSVTRKEDHRLLTGGGKYLADVSVPRQAYGLVLRSPHAHARIVKLDVEAARRSPGVLAVLTAKEVAADRIGNQPCMVPLTYKDGSPMFAPARPLLTGDVVRFVGDPVAFVVAETQEAGRDAAEKVVVEYETLPPVVDMRAAAKGGPQIWPQARGNVCFEWYDGDEAKTDAAFASAAHKVSLDLVNNRLVANSLEPRGAIGEWDAGSESYTLHATTQGVHLIRGIVAEHIFKVPPAKVRVITHDVGGGFGMKVFFYAEYALVLWAAKRLGRPVKWVNDRTDSFLSDVQGRDHLTRVELALDRNYKFTGLRARTLANMGAYLSTFAPFIPTLAGQGMHIGVYDIPAAHVEVKAIFTNTVPIDAYRGAGRPEAAYMIERLVDKAARELQIDPSELRRRNYIQASAMPFKTSLGQVYDSGDFARNMDDALKAADRAGFEARRAEASRRGKLRGLGFAYYIEMCAGPALGPENAIVRFEADDAVTIWIGTQTNGQGHETAYSQVLSEILGIPFEKIRIRQGDTAEIAEGGGTGGSRSIPTGAVSVRRAGEAVIEKGKRIASGMLEAAPADIAFAQGKFTVVGTDRSVPIYEVAKTARTGKHLGAKESRELDGTGTYTPGNSTFPNGCHVAEVEIDPDTGEIEIVAYHLCDDFGRVLNPLLLAGQVHGGIAQGIGQALLEEAVYNNDSGQLVSGSFMDYCMPRAGDIPNLAFRYNEIHCPGNPLGIKGAGEAGAIGAPPAVINAIVDALSPRGIAHIDMPATPQRIWQVLRSRA
jgi:aerobic carbon-monoxide dehydrogenase large subunit